MANVLNRLTKEYIESVNTPEYMTPEWIINPDLSLVIDYPVTYWKIEGDSVSLMSEQEKSAHDRSAPFEGMSLDDVKMEFNGRINAIRDQKLDGGWTYNGTPYDSDPVSRQNMAGTMTLISSGYTLPADFTWRAQDNTNHSFDNASFIQFYQASCIWVNVIFRNSWMMKNDLWNKTTVEEILAMNLTSGYPTGYPFA